MVVGYHVHKSSENDSKLITPTLLSLPTLLSRNNIEIDLKSTYHNPTYLGADKGYQSKKDQIMELHCLPT